MITCPSPLSKVKVNRNTNPLTEAFMLVSSQNINFMAVYDFYIMMYYRM